MGKVEADGLELLGQGGKTLLWAARSSVILQEQHKPPFGMAEMRNL